MGTKKSQIISKFIESLCTCKADTNQTGGGGQVILLPSCWTIMCIQFTGYVCMYIYICKQTHLGCSETHTTVSHQICSVSAQMFTKTFLFSTHCLCVPSPQISKILFAFFLFANSYKSFLQFHQQKFIILDLFSQVTKAILPLQIMPLLMTMTLQVQNCFDPHFK